MARRLSRGSTPGSDLSALWRRYEALQIAQGVRGDLREFAKPATQRARSALEKVIGELPALLDASLAEHDGDAGPDGLHLLSAAEIGRFWTEFFRDAEVDSEFADEVNADRTVRTIASHPARIPIATVGDFPFVCIDRVPGPAGTTEQIVLQDVEPIRLADDLRHFLEYIVWLYESGRTIHDPEHGIRAADRKRVFAAMRRPKAPRKAKVSGGPLLKAASAGDVAAVGRLLEEGAPIDWQDRNGKTALTAAIEAGAADCAELLLRHGADVALKGRDGSPLTAAAYRRNAPWVRRLLDAGAAVDDPLERGETALILAINGSRAGEDNREVIELLLERGADPNHVAHAYGQAVIHFAMRPDVAEAVVAALLEHGADPNAKSASGETAIAALIERATSPDDDEAAARILRLLLDAGARRKTRYFRGMPAAEAKRRGLGRCAKLLA